VGLENPWEGVFMDDERIVGFTGRALHILHLLYNLDLLFIKEIPQYLLRFFSLGL